MRARYTIRLTDPDAHVIGVEASFEGLPPGVLKVAMPEWVPGHYALQNNARFVEDLRATVGRRPVAVTKLDSFVGDVACASLGGTMPGVFIRAPRIQRVGPGVTVLGRLAATDEPVLVAAGHLLGATFHPELTADPRVHRLFLDHVAGFAPAWYGSGAKPPSEEIRAS